MSDNLQDDWAPNQAPPLEELMLSFESLGDNCEFGVVQRLCGVEPLGLLRWMTTPLNGLLDALNEGFKGLGDIDNVVLKLSPHREYVVTDTKFGFSGHTFINERQEDAEKLRLQQAKRLSFLAAKLKEDLEAADKIFVYKTNQVTPPTQVVRLHEALRQYGNAVLLWMMLADDDHPVGSVELIRQGLILGYIDGFGPYENIHPRISLDSWITICRNAHRLWHTTIADGRDDAAVSLVGFDELAAVSHQPQLHLLDAAASAPNGDIAASLDRYADGRTAYPNHPIAFQDSTQLLLKAGRTAEAEALLSEAIARFPDDSNFPVDYARIAAERRDWVEALTRWKAARSRFPVDVAYSGEAAALRELGHFGEAEEVLREALERFPDIKWLLIDVAILAEHQGDWPEAARRWARVREEEPAFWRAYINSARVASAQGDTKTAGAFLAELTTRYPDEAVGWLERAKFAEAEGDWPTAEACWGQIVELQPRDPQGPAGQARSLRNQARFDEADALLEAAMNKFSDEPLLSEEYGLVSIARQDWREASDRLSQAQEQFPSADGIGRPLSQVGLRLSERDSNAAPDDDTGSGNDSDAIAEARELAMQFESLGGTGHGSEFGIFQSHFGAEPRGLLRWADLSEDQLMAALDHEFDGVGDVDNTILFVTDSTGRPEYWSRDARYHMAMRCFAYPEDVPPDRMLSRVTRRLQFLRDKLIQDLKSGEKIFVYKNMKRSLTNAELARLHAAVRRYGNNTLFYIRHADADHPAGLVESVGQGLLVGYILRFTHTPDTNEYLGPSAELLRDLCQSALSISQTGAL
jgi:tetratricopeptide (TPR) repeat protein